MSNTKLFYSYKDTKNTGKVTLGALSSYSDSIIFDEDNRRLWHNGKQYGNTYWGSKHGETFNDLDRNYAYNYAHAEGGNSYAGGEYSHVEGFNNSAYSEGAHVEGTYNISNAQYSHIEGLKNIVSGSYSHVEGSYNSSTGQYSHTEGLKNIVSGNYSHVEGSYNSSTGQYSHTEGLNNIVGGSYSHVEGTHNEVSESGKFSHLEGAHNKASGECSHVEGNVNIASGAYSHAQGYNTESSGSFSNAQGVSTISKGYGSNAEGLLSISYATYSHAEGNSSYTTGAYSHAEGLMTYAVGDGAHAEGENSYAHGKCSHTEGLGTVTYNEYEVAFGKYNESINGGDNPTIYSIGDGTSKSKRHNIIDFRENGDMHKNGNSYFHDNIYGPVSYTYVSSLGDTATLDIVLSSLLTQPEYTRPKITAKYKKSNGGWAYVTTSNYAEETVELGTYFIPEFQVAWPTRTQSNASGTRAYDVVCEPSKPNYLLGYSYGVVPVSESTSYPGISISYNDGGGFESTIPTACNKKLYAYALDTAYSGATSPCYILGETTYTLFSNLQVSYLPFSYMYFQQLYDKGAYVHAMGLPPTEWLNGGVAKLGGFKVNGRLKYFWGFSGTKYEVGQNYPKTSEDLRKGKWGWLPSSSTTSSLEINTNHLKENANKSCLWIAYPDSLYQNDSKHYKLVEQSKEFQIKVKPDSASEFDLIGATNKLKFAYLNDVTLGNSKYKTRYKIAYIDFQKPIGNTTHSIIFRIATNSDNTYSELQESL